MRRATRSAWGESAPARGRGGLDGVLLEPLEPRLLLATTFTVTSEADCVAPDGFVTLREAIEAANTDSPVNEAPAGSGDDVIRFAPVLNGRTITLELGELAISSNIDVQGPGRDLLTIDAHGDSRAFCLWEGSVSIGGMTITRGSTTRGSTDPNDDGGGICVLSGELSLTDVVIRDSDADEGGGIFNGGDLALTRCVLQDNEADTWCGGIYSPSSASAVTIHECTISGNTSSWGAGLGGAGTLNVTGSTIRGNWTVSGSGGIAWYGGVATVANSTVSGNRGVIQGGGIYLSACSLYACNSTVTDNIVAFSNHPMGETGGIFVSDGAAAELHATIVADNFEGYGAIPADVYGDFSPDSSYNLIGLDRESTGLADGVHGNQVGTSGAPIDPLLGSLADNGGPTQTHAPLPGSPVLDAGRNHGASPADQRGRQRICDNPSIANPSGGDGCDIGAVETQLPQVTGVFVRGSAWSEGFLEAIGSELGYRVPTGSSAQLDCLPWGNIDRISLCFTEQVAAAQSDLTVTGDLGPHAIAEYAYDAETFTGTWTLSGPIRMDAIRLHLPDTVANRAGWRLDGEWIDEVSTVSGDGAAGGDFAFRIRVLGGDANQDGRVNYLDYLAFKARCGTQGGAARQEADFDGDGDVDRDDFAILRSTFGRPVNRALEFDGGDYVKLPGEVLNGLTDVTCEFWLRTVRTGQQGIVSGVHAGNHNEFLILLNSDTELSLYTGESAGSCVTWPIDSIADDAWHHVAVVRDDANDVAELYVDGAQQGARPTTLRPLTVAAEGLVIGQEQDHVGGGFQPSQALYGRLDDLRVWDAALTGPEIRDRMYQHLTGAEAHLVGYWDFQEGAGQVVRDGSGGGHDGTLGAEASPGEDDPTRVWAPTFAPAPPPPAGPSAAAAAADAGRTPPPPAVGSLAPASRTAPYRRADDERRPAYTALPQACVAAPGPAAGWDDLVTVPADPSGPEAAAEAEPAALEPHMLDVLLLPRLSPQPPRNLP